MLSYVDTCSFKHDNFTESMEVMRIRLRKNSFLENKICYMYTLELPLIFQCVPTTYVTENKINCSDIYTYQISCVFSLPL